MLDTLTHVRANTAKSDAGTEIRFSELTQAIAMSGAVRRTRRKFEVAREAATRTALLSPLMFMAACASGDSGGGGGGQGPSTVAPPPGDTTPDTQVGRPLAIDVAAGLLANVQAPAGVTPQVTTIALASGATGVVGQPLTSPLGALTVAADGSYTFTPAANATVTALGAGVTATQSFTYTIQSGGTTFAPATLTITLTGVNDAPVAVAPAPVTGSATAPVSLGITVPTDPDINANGQPDPLTVSSIVLRQNGTVNANLASAFRILPDGQAPQEDGQTAPGTPLNLTSLPAVNELDNIVFDPANLPAGTYTFEYTVRDSGGRSVRQTVTITLTNANPTLAADTIAATEDGSAVTGNVLANDTDPEGRALTLTRIAHGAEQLAVVAGSPAAIAGTFGVLTLNADGSYSFALDNTLGTVQALRAGQAVTDSFTYTAIDTNGGASTAQVTVTVTGVNDAPRFIGNQAFVVPEDALAVATLAATDVDNDPLTFSIAGGVDAARFFLNATTGALSFTTLPNFSVPTDANQDNVYELIVRVSDGTETVSRPINVSVTDVNFSPVAGGTSALIAENALPGTVSGNLLVNVSDRDGDRLTVDASAQTGTFGTLVVATDGSFTYTLGTGLATNALALGQVGTDVFSFTVRDGISAPVTASLTLIITGENDAPRLPANLAFDFRENQLASITTLAATDPDGTQFTYALFGAGDNLLFTLDAQTGVLRFLSPPDFEAPQDADADNLYILNVQVTDALGAFIQQTLTVRVTDIPGSEINNPPTFTTPMALSVNERIAAIATLAATDPENDTLSYSITGGANQALFTIDAQSGALAFRTPPAFITGGSNDYQVIVAVSDGFAQPVPRTFTVTVIDVNDAPVAADAAGTIAEDASPNTLAGVLVATDSENDTLTFSLNGSSVGVYGALLLNSDGRYVYTLNNAAVATNQLAAGVTVTDAFTVDVSDGFGGQDTAILTITVTGANDAPVIAATRAESINTGTTAVTAAGGGTDPDSNSTLTYTIAGADAALFTVNAQTGALAFRAAPSFANPQDQGANNIYNLTLTVSDGSLSAAQAVEITVISDNFPPVFENEAEIFVDENTVAAIATLIVTDADGDTVTIGTGGADAARFQLNAVTGALSFITPPDFETPADANGDNIYEVTATASDGQATTTQTLLITVGDVVEAPNNNPPVISGITASSFSTVDPNDASRFTYNELQAATNPVLLVSASDADNDTLTFGLTGADSALFTINTLGQVTFNAAPDFEAPLDAGGDNRYELQVLVSDGAASVTSGLITVVVGNVLENTPPVAANDSFVIIEDDRNPATTDDVFPVTGNVLANDSDVDVTNGVPGQSLRVSAIRTGDLSAGGTTTTVSGPTEIVGQFGVLTINGPGNASYVLNPDQDSLNTGDTRREVFTYTLVDNAGGSTQAELVYAIEGRTDAVAVDAVDDLQTVPLDQEPGGPLTLSGGAQDFIDNDLVRPGRRPEVVAATLTFPNGMQRQLTRFVEFNNNNEISSLIFGFDLSGETVLTYDIGIDEWAISIGNDSTATFSFTQQVNSFVFEYTLSDTDGTIDGLADTPNDPLSFDTARVVINFVLVGSSVAPLAAANASVVVEEGGATSALLRIAAPTDNTPLPNDSITILALPSGGNITVGADGRVLEIGDTLSVVELTSLVWNATGLVTGSYGTFSYSVRDADGNFAPDRNNVTPGEDAQVISLLVVPSVIDLSRLSSISGYTVTPLASGNNGILTSTIAVSATGADFGSALAVDTSGTSFGSIGGSSTRDLVIGAPGALSDNGAVFRIDLNGIPTTTTGNRIVAGGTDTRLGTSLAIGAIPGLGESPSNPDPDYPALIVGAPGVSSGAGAVYILGGASSGNPFGGGTNPISTTSFNGTNGAVITGVAGSGLGSLVAYLGDFGGVGTGPELFLNAPGADSFFSFAGNAPGAQNNTSGVINPVRVTATNAGVGYVIDGGSYAGTNPVEGLRNIANPTVVTPPGEPTVAPITGVGYSLGTANAGGFTAATQGIIGAPTGNSDALVLGNSTTNQVVLVGDAGSASASTAQPGVSGDELNAPLVLSTGNAADALGASLALVDAYGYIIDNTTFSARLQTVNDLLIGAPGRDSSPNGTDNVGAAFLVFGGSAILTLFGSFSLDNTATAARIVEIRNNIAGSGFGTVVADIGDYNGDSIGDFAIGAPGQNGGNGAVYVVFGRAFENNWFGDNNGQTRATLVLDASNLGTDYIRLDGTNGSRAGAAILGLGDINNDGRDDFAIGAPDGGAGANGIVHVIFGTPIAQVADPRAAQNSAPPPQFSASVSVIDADGQVDALLAATLGEGAQAPLDAGVFVPEFGGAFDKALPLAFNPLHNDGMVMHIA